VIADWSASKGDSISYAWLRLFVLEKEARQGSGFSTMLHCYSSTLFKVYDSLFMISFGIFQNLNLITIRSCKIMPDFFDSDIEMPDDLRFPVLIRIV